MHADQPSLQAALSHARASFSAATERMAAEAERSLDQSLSVATGERRANLIAARQILMEHGRTLPVRISALYSTLLERAVDTMYVNQRPALAGLSADLLTLIDDETVNRQIELDRLVRELREIDSLSLGRLNVLIAQIHGEAEARERENPFRPYLLARAVYDGVRELTPKATLVAILFDRLAQAMPVALADFYSSIYGIFESSGVQARLLAMPSRFGNTFGNTVGSARLQRSAGFADSGFGSAPDASHASAGPPPAGPAARQDGLRLIWAAMRSAKPAASAGSTVDFPPRAEATLARLPEPLRLRLQSRRASGTESVPDDSLTGWLNACRQLVLRQPPGPLAEHCRLRVLRQDLPPEGASEAANLLLDLVAALFDWIDAEKRLAPAIRNCLVRLEIPFLHTTLDAPDLLLDAGHPLRELMDHFGALAPDLRESSPVGALLTEEAIQAVQMLLDPDVNPAEQAAACLARFRQRVAERLPEADPDAAACLAVLATVRTATRIRMPLFSALSLTLAPLGLDAEAARFLADAIARTAGRRRARASSGQAGAASATAPTAGNAEDAPSIGVTAEAALLAELVWSLLPQSSMEDRGRLRSRLPGLIRDLRATLNDSGLPDEAIRAGMDRLMEIHGRVLCGPLAQEPCACLDALRARFAAALEPLPPVMPAAQGILLQRLAVEEADMAAALSEHGVAATLFLGSSRASLPEPSGKSASPLQLGTPYTHREAGAEVPVRLLWMDADRCFFLFLPEFGGAPLLFSEAGLQEAIAGGRLLADGNASLLGRAIHALSSDTAVPA